jgi:hypothetical protein
VYNFCDSSALKAQGVSFNSMVAGFLTLGRYGLGLIATSP